MNEKKGDGIISAIDCFVTMDMIKGSLGNYPHGSTSSPSFCTMSYMLSLLHVGEDRLVLTINGKFLSHIEQLTANNTVQVTERAE